MAETEGRPDVVIVVADCLREDEFESASHASPFLRDLRHESVTFPNCTSVSNWTLPAHVSILTGLYPFEHNVHRLGLRSIPPELPTIATSLSAKGYATQLLSANHNLRPDTGFGAGIDQIAWGIWGETALRVTSDARPPFDSDSATGTDLLRTRILDAEPSGLWKVAGNAAAILPRFPWILDGASRVHAGLFRKGARRDYRVAPWIENSFLRFISRQPRDRPLLSVMNFMDCHEPYLPEPSDNVGLAEWLRLVTSRQDVVSWARGRWLPTWGQLDVLRELYRQKVRRMGLRLRNIVNLLKAAGRWGKTLLVLTGDHGQAFGEHGQLFHGGELFEPVTHVPLWIRFPGGEYGGTTVRTQVSLVDIYPTVMEIVDRTAWGPWSGMRLRGLLDRPRPELTVSTADGVSAFGSVLRPSVLQGSPQVAVYSDECKLMVDYQSGRARAFHIREDPRESVNIWPRVETELRGAFTRARSIGAMMSSNRRDPVDHDVSASLRRWGYLD